jgi:hypothetical protein
MSLHKAFYAGALITLLRYRFVFLLTVAKNKVKLAVIHVA